MRAVVQRVSKASVTVEGKTVGRIGPGLAVLLGVRRGDTGAESDWLADKIAHLRIFEDEAGKMNRSVIETGGGVLVVSQFTLYGNCAKGRRPSFVEAADPDPARALYRRLAERMQNLGLAVETGSFGAKMSVSLVNDGPVTLIVETP
ncbi:MAG: D-aminoacyl-tRNA deacylase [Desulfobacterales bacterium]|jgi:D-tyrosyl-tRNA(Tyr) deacylase